MGLVLVLATVKELAFTTTDGFHDTGEAMATSIALLASADANRRSQRRAEAMEGEYD